MTIPSNIHDGFVKKLLEDPDNARDFLRIALPENVLACLDLSQLSIESPSHPGGEGESERFSDIVVKVTLKEELAGQALQAEVYIIYEHKSYKDKGVSLQLLGYMLRKWEQDERSGQPLRVIIPLVFYHGAAKWDVSLNFSDMIKAPEALKCYVPQFVYSLYDTVGFGLSNEQGQAIKNNLILLSSLLLLKNAMIDNVELHRIYFRLWSGRNEEYREFWRLQIRYLLDFTEMGKDELQGIYNEECKTGGDTMPSLAQRLFEDGKQQGMQKNQELTALRLLATGQSLDFIEEITGLSKKRIKELAKENKDKKN